MVTAYLSLGSNLGDRAAHLRAALSRLESPPEVRVGAVSAFYETVPIGETAEPSPLYLNCAARLETSLSPLALLDWTQVVETAGERVRTYRWSPRTIDVDILLYGSVVLNTERLTLPHPRLFERAFALVPLQDLEPSLVFPDGTTLAERLQSPGVLAQELSRWKPPSSC
jgi:2-amino-4-hydroxy-6-hydroxymethyldihydropteridine diphosphokinase